jgi:hypothetical protein
MGCFSEYIPPEILTTQDVRNYVNVLDGLCVEKSVYVNKFSRSFNALTIESKTFLEKWLIDVGNLLLVPGIPRKVIEGLILDSHNIYNLKGTQKGLILFLEIVCCGGARVFHKNLVNRGNFIKPDHLLDGFLMLSGEGTTVGQELVTDSEYQAYLDFLSIASNDFLFIFDHDSYDTGVGTIEIRIASPFAHIKEFRDWIGSIIEQFLPMASAYSTYIEIKLYNHVMITGPYYYVDIP